MKAKVSLEQRAHDMSTIQSFDYRGDEIRGHPQAIDIAAYEALRAFGINAQDCTCFTVTIAQRHGKVFGIPTLRDFD